MVQEEASQVELDSNFDIQKRNKLILELLDTVDELALVQRQIKRAFGSVRPTDS